ncbi:hypothetical protein VC_2173 [Vibrio cholerae O1 biovar El Tor str. N16961]|uniref:Uncharacterized protein n=1 Tax=Vibrio cholerae serotype O1 (strain ATCC 39315 / El Tor Inaba N16961) TaxID=243277 RepID=Q9KQ31_VIBCH|nr:hypothetical protein VC_2173 [Vibrio cholerae O1 biovar El Tor str. N16961]
MTRKVELRLLTGGVQTPPLFVLPYPYGPSSAHQQCE